MQAEPVVLLSPLIVFFMNMSRPQVPLYVLPLVQKLSFRGFNTWIIIVFSQARAMYCNLLLIGPFVQRFADEFIAYLEALIYKPYEHHK